MRILSATSGFRSGALRLMHMLGALGLILGLGGFAWRSANAELQNDAIGFSPNHVFEQAEAGEHIDVMSGNMTLSIPLGPRYKLTDDFSWGVTLYYNSKVWEHYCPPNPFDPTKHVCLGTLSDYDAGRNFGLGFSIHPGFVYHNPLDYSYIYRVRLEDGADHMFCARGYSFTFQPGELSQDNANCPSTTSVTEGGITELGYVTVDGSHIVMSQYGPSNHRRWRARTSDGRTIDFDSVWSADGAPYSAAATRVATSTQRSDGQPRAWVDYLSENGHHIIRDSQCRTVSFDFDGSQTTSISFPGISQPYKLITTALTVLDPTDIQDIPSTDPDLWRRYHTVGVLSSIEFPGIPERYQFDYLHRSDGAIVDNTLSYGWMTQRTLPTGQVVNYDYDVYSSSARRPYHVEMVSKKLVINNQPYRWGWNRFSLAPFLIAPANENVKTALWSDYAGSNPFQVAARDAFNNVTLYRFAARVVKQSPTNPGDPAQDSPGTLGVCHSDGECENYWSDGTMLSMSQYAGPNPDDAHLLRRVTYEWDSDRKASPNDDQHIQLQYRLPHGQPVYPDGHADPAMPQYEAAPINLHQISETTYVPGGQSGGHSVTVKKSDWVDGVGCAEPRRKDEYIDGAFYRSTYTAIAPIAGDCAAHSYVQVTDALGNVVSRVDRKFNDDAQLECEIRRKSSNSDQITSCQSLSLGSGDVVTVNSFYTDTTRALHTTTISGGENTDSRTITMNYAQLNCTVTDANGTPISVAGNSGYLTKKNYGFSWNAIDRTVDLSRGLTVQSHDTAGNATNYEWDDLGRLTRITPGADPSASDPPEVATVITYPTLRDTHVTRTISATDFTETDYSYDTLGRLIRTRQRNATGGFEAQTTEYDIAGHVARRSEWAPDNSTPIAWTTYDYTQWVDPESGTKYPDPLGRIHGVTTPDDVTPETPTTETTYDGNRSIVTVRDINSLVGGQDSSITSTTVYTKDPLGRLISVDSAGSGADASYTYDESDNLTEADLVDPVHSPQTAPNTQTRTFVYDKLGRLRSATNPENGTVVYSAYDARGNLLSYTDAMQNMFTMIYDAADRLSSRFLGPTELVSNAYESGSSRLAWQTTFKLENGGPVTVSQIHLMYGAANSSQPCGGNGIGGFAGLNGRLMSQTTTFGSNGAAIETDFCENRLGLPTLVRYPDFANSGRTRTETLSTYNNGKLMTLTDLGRYGATYISNVRYGVGGVPTEIDRVANEDVIDLDVRNRPSRLRVVGYTQLTNPPSDGVTCDAIQADPLGHPSLMGFPCGDADDGSTGGFLPATLWDSGAYAYDMAGNVKHIGLDRYGYDPLSRLVSGSMAVNGTAYNLAYGYDAFGNMTSQQNLPNNLRSYVVDWRTNRVTSQSMGGSTLGYVYDTNGNLISEGVSGVTGDARAFVYDPEGRLREVMDPEKGRLGNYDYDASGYRVRAEADGKEIFYVRDAAGQVLSEFQRDLTSNEPPVWNKDYIYALGRSLELIQNAIPRTPQRPVPSKVASSDADLSTRLRLAWPNVQDPDIARYRVNKYWRKSSLDTTDRWVYFDINAPTDGTNPFWDDTYSSYAASQCLSYTVQSIDSAGNISDAGPELRVCPVNTDTVPPPVLPTATAGIGSVKIAWTAPSWDARRVLGYYVIGRLTGASNQVRLNQDWLKATEFVDTPVAPYLLGYRYKVVMVDTSLRESAPAVVSPSPIPVLDTIAPGRISKVTALPDAPAHTVIVSWWPGADVDVTSYSVYRSTTAGVLGNQVGSPINFVAGRATYSVTDSAAVEGQNNYYTVLAYDSRNYSSPSDQVAARPRVSSIAAPVVLSAAYGVDQGATPTTADALASAENDDIIYVKLRWEADGTSLFRIYRKGPDDAQFRSLGPPATCQIETISGVTACTYRDDAANDSPYTYYVVRVGGQDESAAGVLVATSVFDPAQVWVRTLYIEDGREMFSTGNASSRFATVHWSRVDQPGLIGYNVYRMCELWSCNEGYLRVAFNDFACVPEWTRVNDHAIAPDQVAFGDGTTGGLMGCYAYAVRPIGPGNIEGAITTIVGANLIKGEVGHGNPWYHGYAVSEIVSDDLKRQETCSPRVCSASPTYRFCNSDANCPVGEGYCTTDLMCTTSVSIHCSDDADCPHTEAPYNGQCVPREGCGGGGPWVPEHIPIDWALNGAVIGINLQTRTGDPSGPPSPVASARMTLLAKAPTELQYSSTTLAQVSWSWGGASPPSDLKGYFIETAGSPDGPWQRLTRQPVAWWERRYTVQGIDVKKCDLPTGHPECLRYRIITVDEDGNESVSVPAVPDRYSNPAAQTCQQTPDPPKNLRVSTANPPDLGGCVAHLDWDASPGATDYFVYRMVLTSNFTPYFYQTQHLAPAAGQTAASPTYEERGDAIYTPTGGNCQDTTCSAGDLHDCPASGLQAFYVTAWAPLTGESPRSNLVFWDCASSPGYVSQLTPSKTEDAIPSMDGRSQPDSLACWLTDGTAVPDTTAPTALPPIHRVANAFVEKPLRLGSLVDPDPPWEVYDLHTDHLGSVRLETKVTPAGAVVVSRHDYFPFGDEVPPPPASFNTHQYTGHERDSWTAITGAPGRTLDYMLARYYQTGLGRFLSVDPSRKSVSARRPSSWNRFTYANDNPMSLVDPDGQKAIVFLDNQTTGSEAASFNVQHVATGIAARLNLAGADANVRIGSPSAADRAALRQNGDTVHSIVLVNAAASNAEPTTAKSVGVTPVGGATSEVRTSAVAKDNPSTSKNEKETELANTGSHELGHQLGLDHNHNDLKGDQDVMSAPIPEGSLAKPLKFNEQDSKNLQGATRK